MTLYVVQESRWCSEVVIIKNLNFPTVDDDLGTPILTGPEDEKIESGFGPDNPVTKESISEIISNEDVYVAQEQEEQVGGKKFSFSFFWIIKFFLTSRNLKFNYTEQTLISQLTPFRFESICDKLLKWVVDLIGK